MPRRQRGSTSAGAEIPPPCLAVVAPARGQPLLDRVAQVLVIDAGPAVDRAQEGQALVGRSLAVALGDRVEPGFDVPAADRVERAPEPVAQIEVPVAAVAALGRRRPAVPGLDILGAGVAQGRQGAGTGALPGRVADAGDPAQQFLGQAPCPVRGDPAVAADHDALVGRLAPAVAGPVVDDEGLGAGGLDPAAETGQPVVPGNPGPVPRL